MNIKNQWLVSSRTDLLVLFIPVWIIWAVFFSNSEYFSSISLPLWGWVVFILGVDVAHVWSSIFRTYAEKEEFRAHKLLLILTPILVLTASLLLLSISVLWFWRVMAYLAVFHFIKQQYGFVALYKMRAKEKKKKFITDKQVIYLATIYPVIYWHFNADASFNWFVANDFLPLHTIVDASLIKSLFLFLNIAYWTLISFWLLREVWRIFKGKSVSTGKILWVLTTAINWWFGIVYFNSDLIFSVSNVVAHGVPYLLLIYYYRVKKVEVIGKAYGTIRKLKWAGVLVVTILLAAFVEEYFWDMFVYRDHSIFFESVYPYRWEQLTEKTWLIIAIALLALPQQVHYVIDGFIWKVNHKNKYLKAVFMSKNES